MRPAKFEFFINLQTAKTLDIKMPPQRLAAADGLIDSTALTIRTREPASRDALTRRLSRSLPPLRNSAWKRFGEARDWRGTLGDAMATSLKAVMKYAAVGR
jgi:hypothetical protein